jgi:hypothetical protein
MYAQDAGESRTHMHTAKGTHHAAFRDEDDATDNVILLSEGEVDALARWAQVGVAVAYEDEKTITLDAAARRAAATGAPFTLDDLRAASSDLRASADIVGAVIERITQAKSARVLLRGESDGGYDPMESAGETGAAGTVPRMLLCGECLDCEEDVDPVTRHHQGTTHPGCPETGDEEPHFSVSLCCPHCGSSSIAEVNVGEVWDAVLDIALDGGFLTVTIGQESGMDRVGDGWLCTSCTTRLSLPEGVAFEFEYR